MLCVSNLVRHCLTKLFHRQTETNRLDKWTTRWRENCLTCQAQSIVTSDMTSSCRFVPNSICTPGADAEASTVITASLTTWMMGQNAPLASLQVIWNGEQWLICCTVVLPFRGLLTVCTNGLMEASWSSTKENAKSCNLWGIASHNSSGLGQMTEKQLDRRESGCPGAHKVECEAAVHPCSKEAQWYPGL